MLTYDITKAKGSIYEYIYQCIKSDIICAKLATGEKLPSKRTMAKNHGISTITIQNAYDQLICEGYVISVPKKGYYVASLSGMTKMKKETNISYHIDVPKENHAGSIDLSDNRTDTERFPFSVWARMVRNVLSEKTPELMEVSPTGGSMRLREAIAGHLKSFRGLLVDPNQIVVGAGTEYLYGLIIQLLGAEKTYCIENPGYKKLSRIYAGHHISCRYANLDEMGITCSGLEATRANVAHICPNHHFPTGITMPAKRRYEVLSWASAQSGRYIIEDDYDSEFRLNGRPIPTLFSIDESETVIYMNTFAKSLTPTIRISYMVLPVHLANLFYRTLSFYACTVSNFEQFTLAEFINEGYFEKHINRMRLYYIRKREKLMEAIGKSRLHSLCEIIENDSGLHFLLQLHTNQSDHDVQMALEAKGIHVAALSEYYFVQSDKEHYFIMNYSNFKLEKASQVFDEIASVI